MKPFEKRSVMAILFAFALCAPQVSAAPFAAAANAGTVPNYGEYAADFSNWEDAGESILLTAQTAESGPNSSADPDFRGLGKAAVLIRDDGTSRWLFSVPKDALYELAVTYIAGAEGSADLEMQISLDGRPFFRELTVAGLKRTFEQGKISANAQGNDVKPAAKEAFVWREQALSDPSGFETTPYRFGIAAGEHVLEISGSRGTVGIHSVELRPRAALISYAEYTERYAKYAPTAGQVLPLAFIEGENPTYKSDLTIQPKTDRSSSATTPQSAAKLLLNTIGGDGWKNPGEFITWSFDIEETGIYQIIPRFRQNTTNGVFTSRKLMIDGEVPFAEAENLSFNYSGDWQAAPLGGEAPYGFFLEKGKHTITMLVSMGDLTSMIRQASESLAALNEMYRKIVMITGSSPDIYRDYNFKQQIPDVIEAFHTQSRLLSRVVSDIEQATGQGGSYTAIIKKLVFQLEQMHGHPRTMAKYLEQFKSNLGALGTWLLSATVQPLEIDSITIQTAASPPPRAGAGFFQGLIFSLKCFFSTFFVDYSAVGQGGGGAPVLVWAQTGRDQAEIVRGLVESELDPSEDLSVKVELVAAGTLLPSVLAGIGPDVALDNAAAEPINYALRGAAMDLSRLKGCAEIMKRFPAAALAPYSYQGGLFALPQTFSFPMFFYRTDIFEELGFDVPDTWDRMISMIPDLQRYNLELGVPATLEMFATVLYQNGGTLYNDQMLSNLHSNTALASFEEFTELYSLYNLPVAFDFANRFRTGEMPCAIQDYTAYNQISLFAPEIKGLWKMVPVPGKAGAGKEVNRTVIGGGTAAVMLSKTKNREAAWRFIKWWTSADIQASFGRRMESVVGTGAKQPTANMEALNQVTWSHEEYQNLNAQMNRVTALPQPPGSYYLARTFSFAFNRVYSSSGEQSMAENPTDVLAEYVKELNGELERKRKEFDQ